MRIEAGGKTVSRSEALGRPIGAMDALLAATAPTHRLTLVTRNVSDLPLLKAILNPWTDPGDQGLIFGVCSPTLETRDGGLKS